MGMFEYVSGIMADISIYLFGMMIADGFFIMLNSGFSTTKSNIRSDLLSLNINF